MAQNTRGGIIRGENYTLWLHEDAGTEREQDFDLKDYKFYCFDGRMKFMMINSDRNSNRPTRADYFDRNFQWLDFSWGVYACRDSTGQTPSF